MLALNRNFCRGDKEAVCTTTRFAGETALFSAFRQKAQFRKTGERTISFSEKIR
jgi:hypothetical protein